MTSKRITFSASEKPTLRQHGFTLLETLVAMMILSIALVIILQQFSGALNAGHISESYSRAVWHAREKMDELLLQETLAPESREGEFGDGYRWWCRIEPAGADGPPGPQGPALFTITVWVEWQQGRRTKQMNISTLALSKTPEG
jgi:general secretion pathway protein I